MGGVQSSVWLENTAARWCIPVPSDGVYLLEIQYRSDKRDICEELSVNGRKYKVGFAPSYGCWCKAVRPVLLMAGKNSISLRMLDVFWRDETGTIEVNRVSLAGGESAAPIKINPQVVPQENILYRTCVTEVRMHIRYFYPPQRVLWNGRKVPYRLRYTGVCDHGYWLDDAMDIIVPGEVLLSDSDISGSLVAEFADGQCVSMTIVIREKPAPSLCTITAIDVGHGASVLICLPDKSWMLVDSGYTHMARRRVIPFLRSAGVDHLACYMITHPDADHCGAHVKIRNEFCPARFIDYQAVRAYDDFLIGNAAFTILNAWENGEENNTRSISFRMEYNGFVYTHGGDIYAENQRRILRERPGLVPADVYHGNHHLFGTMDSDYLLCTNPILFLAQANLHCYTKGEHITTFMDKTERILHEGGARLKNTLRSGEVGNITLRVYGPGHFTWECYGGNAEARALNI